MGNDKGKFLNYRDESRHDWGVKAEPGQQVNKDQIELGARLRMADALEVIAEDKQRLLDEVEYLKGLNKSKTKVIKAEQRRNKRLKNSLRSQKGWVTRLQKKLENKEDALKVFRRFIQSVATGPTGYRGDHTVYTHKVAQRGLDNLKAAFETLKNGSAN